MVLQGGPVLCISIHTPAKGVTYTAGSRNCITKNFNPHSREGSDELVLIKLDEINLFQSTLPRRE